MTRTSLPRIEEITRKKGGANAVMGKRWDRGIQFTVPSDRPHTIQTSYDYLIYGKAMDY